MNSILSLPSEELGQWLSQSGHPAYRARQIRQWLFQRRASSFDIMTDLPRGLRAELAGQFHIWSTEQLRVQQDRDGTEKLLLGDQSGGRVECVLLRDGPRRTVCLSSQVGCGMGCVFCASGLDGLERNLRSWEMVEQALRLQQLLPDSERLSHVVMMGMGEPLANLDHVLSALEHLSESQALGISPRRMTISTVGLPGPMQRLARQGKGYNLAVSLHAPNDKLRKQLVPSSARIGLHKILEAADEYFELSGRRLTFEYVLLAGINDLPQHAQQLGELLKGRPALVNLIPLNPVAGLPYQTPSPRSATLFCQVLEQAGLNVQVRRRKGAEIQAACGQLRRASLS